MANSLFSLLPLDYFTSGNSYTGSLHNFNYKLTPKEQLCAQVWYGKMCSEKSEIAAEEQFPLSNEGIALLLQWLENEYGRRPK